MAPDGLLQSTGKEFEDAVGDIYRSMGYEVTPNVELGGQQTDLVARREIEGGPMMTLAIECKDQKRPIDNATVAEFVTTIVAQRAQNLDVSGVMVSKSGFTAPGRATALDTPFITLFSWEELSSRVLNVRHHVRNWVSQYERSPIFHDYVPLAVTPLSWNSLTPHGATISALEEVVDDWLTDAFSSGVSGVGKNSSVFILADFGSGKTTLLRHLQYRQAKAYLDRRDTRIPLFVPLRDFRDSQDVTALLRGSFRKSYYRDLPNDLLWEHIRNGWFYFLLDGFDEMVDRSNANRRLELFRLLLDLFHSSSPTILSSRPSYFVEHDEFDGLISMLKSGEAAVTALAPTQLEGASIAADDLRLSLVHRHREAPVEFQSRRSLNSLGVKIVELCPLDRERIKEIVQAHEDELREADTTPAAVLDFIDETYDLADLASRPLLLALIIDSIVLRGLDLTSSGTQFGPSGLYEVYTRIKLDVDLSKGPTRRRGLSLEARRLLAEALAIKMYRANALELDFREMLTELLDDSDLDVSKIRDSGLSRDEIATDFATCSFITLDRSSSCRFVHKSFRGFFVARVLKDHLWKGLHPLFSEWLEPDVLYFLGGFAPTQPQVAKNLWAKFRNSSKRDRTLRRNLLVAFLYTKPNHDVAAIADAEIAEADFGRLSFKGTVLRDSAWRKCKIADLSVDSAVWKAVRVTDSRFGRLSATNSDIPMAIDGTDIESVSLKDAKCDFSTQAVSIGDFQAESSSVRLTLKTTTLSRLTVDKSELACDFSWQDTQVEAIRATKSRLLVACDWLPALHATHSIVEYKGVQSHVADWGLAESVVVLDADPNPESPNPGLTPLGSGLSGDGRSVVLAPNGVNSSLLGSLETGVFGALAATDRHPISEPNSGAWGILAADEWISSKSSLPGGAEGHRLGNVLLVTRTWYDRETAAGGRLALLGKLTELTATEQPDADAAEIGEMLPDLLSAVRVAYEHIAEATWIEPNGPR